MRQKPIGRYIVDFYCSKYKLVIEIDGNSHSSEQARKKDIIRQKYLENLGLTVLRFDDRDVKQDLDGVVRAIESWIAMRTTPLPPLLRGNNTETLTLKVRFLKRIILQIQTVKWE